jgi:ADP-heptose:LPS heptosyltransferase
LTGLPRPTGMMVENIPRDIPYLLPDPARVAHSKAQLHGLTPRGLQRVGIDGPAAGAYERLEALDDAGRPGANHGSARLIRLSAEVDGFDDTMAIMAGLELVLTVNTSVTHLAGAMGVPFGVYRPAESTVTANSASLSNSARGSIGFET